MPCIFIDNMTRTMGFRPNDIRTLHEQLEAFANTEFEIHVPVTNANYMILRKDGLQLPAEDVHVRVVGYPRKESWCREVATILHDFLSMCGARGTDITFSPADSPSNGNILFFVNGEQVKRSN